VDQQLSKNERKQAESSKRTGREQKEEDINAVGTESWHVEKSIWLQEQVRWKKGGLRTSEQKKEQGWCKLTLLASVMSQYRSSTSEVISTGW
jgi:hypothetical protein